MMMFQVVSKCWLTKLCRIMSATARSSVYPGMFRALTHTCQTIMLRSALLRFSRRSFSAFRFNTISISAVKPSFVVQRCSFSSAPDQSANKLTVENMADRKQASNELVLQAIELSKRGTNSRNVGLLIEAVALFESAVDCAEKGLPANDADLFLFYEQLADAYGRVNDFFSAEKVGQKSLALLEKLADETASIVNNNVNGNSITLEELQQLQLQLARTQRNVAIACEMQHKLAQSEVLFRQSLAMLQYIHPQRARAKAMERAKRTAEFKQFQQTGSVSADQPIKSSQPEHGEKLLARGPGAAAVRDDLMQKEYDADMASVLHHLGMCIDKQTDSESASASGPSPRRAEAEKYLRLALAIREKIGGLDHVSCAIGLHDLAVNLQAQQRDLEAEIMFRRAIQVRKDEKEKDQNPTYLMTLHSLGELYFQQMQFKLADTLLRKVALLRKKKFGDDSLLYAATLDRHADVILRHVPEYVAEEGCDESYHDQAAKLKQQAASVREAHAAKLAAEALKAQQTRENESKLLGEEQNQDAGFKQALADAASHKPTAQTS